MNIICCCLSALTKNSSISCADGMILLIEFCFLLVDAVALVRLVVEPGASKVSGSLIRLEGVVSLTFLPKSDIK